MSGVLYHLRDQNLNLVAAWTRCFAGVASVETSHGDIFGDGARADALVSPANSFGYMDGGIDAAYLDRFGVGLQSRLQAVLRAEHDGELPVGQAVIVATGDAEIPLLVSAPTMRIPEDVSGTVNAYLAFRAVIRAVRAHNLAGRRPTIRSVLCPGLATAIGKMPYPVAAQQMLLAYLVAAEGRHEYHDRAFKVVHNHRAMRTGEPIRFATA